jgi:hypothetical protein
VLLNTSLEVILYYFTDHNRITVIWNRTNNYTVNAGLDFGFVNNKLLVSVSITKKKRTTEDLLLYTECCWFQNFDNL